MIHILSERYFKEFNRVQQLVRVGMSLSEAGREPVLLIKAPSLTLKYMIRRKAFRLIATRVPARGHLLYAVEIEDDPQHPASLWSVVESDEEMEAISALVRIGICKVHLFNEAIVNVCGAEVPFAITPRDPASILAGVTLYPAGSSNSIKDAASILLDQIHNGRVPNSELLIAVPRNDYEWAEVTSHYITNELSTSVLSIITGTEGRQQEELAVWLVDSLALSRVVKNPQVHEENNRRELSDILISYPRGCFLIESKSLSIFGRPELPDRTTLGRKIVKHVEGAVRQLIGGSANIKRGLKVTDERGDEVSIARDEPIHCIVLIPDLSLLVDCVEMGATLLKRFASETRGFLHILDPNELLHIVRNALFLSSRSQDVLPIMAFDAILMERWRKALRLETPYFNFTVKLSE